MDNNLPETTSKLSVYVDIKQLLEFKFICVLCKCNHNRGNSHTVDIMCSKCMSSCVFNNLTDLINYHSSVIYECYIYNIPLNNLSKCVYLWHFQDSSPLTSMSLSGYSMSLEVSVIKRGTCIRLHGMGKIYFLHDDDSTLVSR